MLGGGPVQSYRVQVVQGGRRGENKKWIVWVGIFMALLVGYSRIYQAQHFPIDITGGIVVAMFTVWVSLKFQIWLEKKYFTQ